MDLKWVNRDNNMLVDAHTNEIFDECDMKKLIPVVTNILKAHFTTAAVYTQRGAEQWKLCSHQFRHFPHKNKRRVSTSQE